MLDDAVSAGNQLAALLTDPDGRSLIGNFPLTRLAAFPGSPFTPAAVRDLLEAMAHLRA